MSKPIEVVLFDLGGVLVELGGAGELGGLVGESSEELLWSRWLRCPWVRRFERGQCGEAEFAEGMVEAWDIELCAEDFLEAFAVWPKGLYPGARALVESLSGKTRTACLSNTNALHTRLKWSGGGIRELFETCFFSHEIGLVKPDREAFDHTVAVLGCSPESILFLDDNAINVEAARRAGLRAEIARGPDAVRGVLRNQGLDGE